MLSVCEDDLVVGLVAGGPVVKGASSLTEVDEEEAVLHVTATDAFFLVLEGLTGRGGRSLLRF
jgi:hypothetical protein